MGGEYYGKLQPMDDDYKINHRDNNIATMMGILTIKLF
jgi:hypothetical protein